MADRHGARDNGNPRSDVIGRSRGLTGWQKIKVSFMEFCRNNKPLKFVKCTFENRVMNSLQ